MAVGLRVPFAGLPLTADEGGYGEVARLWVRGRTLYDDAWVDRPQGLLLIFRLVLHLGGSPEAMRAVAAVAAGLTVLAVAALAARTGGRIVAAGAAVLLATFGASPFLESFTLAGELLAALPVALSLLAFAVHLRRRSLAWLCLAGLLAGVAVTIKQSAIDAGVAELAVLLWLDRRRAWRTVPVLLAVALLPTVAALLAAPDAGDWWRAVVGYRGQGDSVATGSIGERWDDFTRTLWPVAKALAPLVLPAALGWRPSPVLARAWLGGAVLGVLGGGNFHAHYYIQLAPPLALLAGFGVRRLAEPRLRLAALAAAGIAVAAVVLTAPVYAAGADARTRRIFPHDPHLLSDAAVARQVRARTRPGEPVLVVWAAAGVYYLADRPPAVPWMWRRPVESVPGAVGAVRDAIRGRVPRVVVVAQDPDGLDGSGETARLLARGYRTAAVVDGVQVLAPR